ncbi:MAG: hypothetical protein HOV81_26530 [Kofleriaceae bacterium]|nr:hypothetical protein [Kofleriaceae bacterium]
MLTGLIIGIVVAVAVTIANRSKAKAGTGIPGQVEQMLRERGTAMTLQEIAVAMNKDSLLGRGDIVQALSALQGIGKIRTIPAPEGTPQLKKKDFIKYEAVQPPPAT